MTSRRSFLLTLSAFACAALVLVSQANAGTVQRTINFDPSSAGTFFSADVTATGGVSLSANAQLSLNFGTVLSISPTITIPSQSFPINESSTVVSTPNGTMTLELPDTSETFGGAFPNLAGALTEADVPAMDVTLVDSTGVGILNLNPSVTGTTSIDILGLTSIDFPLQANLTVDTLLKDVVYSQVGNAFLGPGTVIDPNVPGNPPGSITTSYEIPGPNTGGVVGAGNASLGAEVNVAGDVNVDLGIFGSFGGSIPTTNVVDTTVPVDTFALLFDMFLTDLQPTLFGGPRDVGVDIDGNFDIIGALPAFDFNNSGSVPIPSTPFTIPIDLGFGTVDVDAVLTGTFDFDLAASVQLDNLQYGLEDENVPDLLVPEPSSIMLVVMGLIALMPAVALRRRKS